MVLNQLQQDCRYSYYTGSKLWKKTGVNEIVSEMLKPNLLQQNWAVDQIGEDISSHKSHNLTIW